MSISPFGLPSARPSVCPGLAVLYVPFFPSHSALPFISSSPTFSLSLSLSPFLIFVFRCQHRPYKNSHAPRSLLRYFISGHARAAPGLSARRPRPHPGACPVVLLPCMGRFVQYVTRSVALRRDEKSPSLWTDSSRRRRRGKKKSHMWMRLENPLLGGCG